jgi:hypothetical protein
MNQSLKKTPLKNKDARSKTEMQIIGDWLFRGTRVYLLSEPDRILKQKKIRWDRQTCDVEDETGRVLHDIPWDDLEFWDEVEFNLPDED